MDSSSVLFCLQRWTVEEDQRGPPPLGSTQGVQEASTPETAAADGASSAEVRAARVLRRTSVQVLAQSVPLFPRAPPAWSGPASPSWSGVRKSPGATKE